VAVAVVVQQGQAALEKRVVQDITQVLEQALVEVAAALMVVHLLLVLLELQHLAAQVEMELQVQALA